MGTVRFSLNWSMLIETEVGFFLPPHFIICLLLELAIPCLAFLQSQDTIFFKVVINEGNGGSKVLLELVHSEVSPKLVHVD